MSKTRAFLLELVSAGLAFGAGLTLWSWGVPGVIILPICAVVAWYQMGFFIKMWEANKKIKGGEESGKR